MAMKRVIAGWLTSGRRTTRSIAKARTTITVRVAAIASQKFIPFSVMPAKTSAAKKTIAPCAKFSTPEAL